MDSTITTNIFVEEDIVYDVRDIRSLVKKYNCEFIKKLPNTPVISEVQEGFIKF